MPSGNVRRVRNSALLLGAGLSVTECVWATLSATAGAPELAWLAGHIALVATAGVIIWWTRGSQSDLAVPALALMSTLIAGPLGAVLSSIAIVWLSSDRVEPDLLTAWYERISLAGDIDPVTRLCNTVMMGRAVQTTASLPQVFAHVMAHGSLEDRQNALGLIARQFSPSYAPALRAALVSSEPVIRVQAAAVAVKVRAELKQTLRTALDLQAKAADGQANLDVAAQIHGMAGSRLLDDADQAAAERCVKAMVSATVSGWDPASNASAATVAGLVPEMRNQIETELLNGGSFAAFRAVRALVGGPQGGRSGIQKAVEPRHG